MSTPTNTTTALADALRDAARRGISQDNRQMEQHPMTTPKEPEQSQKPNWKIEPHGTGWLVTRPLTAAERDLYGVSSSDSRGMSILGISSDEMAIIMEEADARLVAAAPDLLRSLIICRSYLTGITQLMLPGGILYAGREKYGVVLSDLAAIDAAIGKTQTGKKKS